MINYFKRIFTGYSTVKKNINGIEYKYLYSKKPIFFDPMLMLGEFVYRAKEEVVQNMPLKISKDEILKIFTFPADKILPSVICSFESNGAVVKVSRFTSKEGGYPQSSYYFEMDGIVFSHFKRIYDYGGQLIELKNLLLVDSFESKPPVVGERWLLHGQEDQKVFLEKFGHTQIWYFTDFEKLSFLKLT